LNAPEGEHAFRIRTEGFYTWFLHKNKRVLLKVTLSYYNYGYD
jgi:hypothetical protein